MKSLKLKEISRVLREAWPDQESADSREHARRLHDLLATGAGEDQVVEDLRLIGAETLAPDQLVPFARALLKIGVRPKGTGWRRRKMAQGNCSVCRQQSSAASGSSWGCPCGFRICQSCLDENSWGLTCNGITWECPDCGRFRSF